MKNFLAIAACVLVFGALFAGAAGIGMDSKAKYECHTWAAEASSTPGFYLAQWQKAQCDYYGITVTTK